MSFPRRREPIYPYHGLAISKMGSRLRGNDKIDYISVINGLGNTDVNYCHFFKKLENMSGIAKQEKSKLQAICQPTEHDAGIALLSPSS